MILGLSVASFTLVLLATAAMLLGAAEGALAVLRVGAAAALALAFALLAVNAAAAWRVWRRTETPS